jgi:hypothetical protein
LQDHVAELFWQAGEDIAFALGSCGGSNLEGGILCIEVGLCSPRALDNVAKGGYVYWVRD